MFIYKFNMKVFMILFYNQERTYLVSWFYVIKHTLSHASMLFLDSGIKLVVFFLKKKQVTSVFKYHFL